MAGLTKGGQGEGLEGNLGSRIDVTEIDPVGIAARVRFNGNRTVGRGGKSRDLNSGTSDSIVDNARD